MGARFIIISSFDSRSHSTLRAAANGESFNEMEKRVDGGERVCTMELKEDKESLIVCNYFHVSHEKDFFSLLRHEWMKEISIYFPSAIQAIETIDNRNSLSLALTREP